MAFSPFRDTIEFENLLVLLTYFQLNWEGVDNNWEGLEIFKISVNWGMLIN